MIDRRVFITGIAKASIGALATNKLFSFLDPKKYSFGLLLGTVAKYMQENPEDTLDKIAAIGFKELEYPRTYGHPAKTLKQIIDRAGLSSLGGGDDITTLSNLFPALSEEYNQMGKRYVFCYWPWFDDGKKKSIDDWKRQADILNKLGQKYKSVDLRLAYHNHNIEFIETEGQVPYEILLTHLDPELITFEMDLWWIRKAGYDPITFIQHYPGRFEVCHIKTAGLIEKSEKESDLGYRPILQVAHKAGFKHLILENELQMINPFEFIKESFTLLGKFI